MRFSALAPVCAGLLLAGTVALVRAETTTPGTAPTAVKQAQDYAKALGYPADLVDDVFCASSKMFEPFVVCTIPPFLGLAPAMPLLCDPKADCVPATGGLNVHIDAPVTTPSK